MLKKLLLLGAVLSLIGCASNPPMNKSAVDEMRANDVAVAFVYPEKKINYNELVYKVLWNETHVASAGFDGIWDIDGDLTGQFVHEFQAKGLNAIPLDAMLDNSEYGNFTDSMASFKPGPQQQFSLDEKLRTSLLENGVEYLIAMRGNNIFVQASSGWGLNPRVTLFYYMSVIDLRSGKTEYTGGFALGDTVDVDKSAREIEDNGLAKLRTMISKSLHTSFEKDVVTKDMGMVASAN